MNKKKNRRLGSRQNAIQPILEESLKANEQLQLYVSRALQEMIPLCMHKCPHHRRSILHRIHDCCISIEISVTPWKTTYEEPEFLERL